jgi:class 3 adenylate cyclase
MPDPSEPERRGRTPSPVEMVSDSDRDQTVSLLREHMIVGRLTLDEFSERVGGALRARTRDDLESSLADLPDLAAPPSDLVRHRPRRWFVAVMSGSRARGRWRISGRTTAVAVMGGCEMDLRYAEIDGPEVAITAVAFWGGITVTVPEGFEVELHGFSLMGGRNVKLRNGSAVPGSPRIRIRGIAIMGGINIRSRPLRTGRGVRGSPDGGRTESVPVGRPSGDPPDLELRDRSIRRSEPGPADDAATPGPSISSEGTVTILFSDMVDYAGMTERLGDGASREILRAHHLIVRESLESHGGREINVQGDGFMVAFGGVARALRCAVQIQRTFHSYSEAHGEQPIRVHIGVHTGEAVEEENDVLGHTVIVASRIADAAGAGEIVVSALSEQMVERTDEFRFVDHREAVLKGLTRPQPVATLVWAA